MELHRGFYGHNHEHDYGVEFESPFDEVPSSTDFGLITVIRPRLPGPLPIRGSDVYKGGEVWYS